MCPHDEFYHYTGDVFGLDGAAVTADVRVCKRCGHPEISDWSTEPPHTPGKVWRTMSRTPGQEEKS